MCSVLKENAARATNLSTSLDLTFKKFEQNKYYLQKSQKLLLQQQQEEEEHHKTPKLISILTSNHGAKKVPAERENIYLLLPTYTNKYSSEWQKEQSCFVFLLAERTSQVVMIFKNNFPFI